MYKDLRVAVVVPARDEAELIGIVLEGLPDWIDRVIVVDDGSTDGTATEADQWAAKRAGRVEVIVHERPGGVGAAMLTGYRAAYEWGADVAVVMAGDNQMNPAELPSLLDPIAAGDADYTKGNRLCDACTLAGMPRSRLVGNAVFSILTRLASGYWHVADSQNGYTAIHRRALKDILDMGLYAGYGVPNDILVSLNIIGARVRDVPMASVYGVGERSKLRIPRVVLPIAALLVRRFFDRLWQKYVVRDTHPLVLFYLLGLILTPLGIGYGVTLVLVRLIFPHMTVLADLAAALRPYCSDAGIVLDAVLTLSGLQMLLFAMWFDMQHNSHLR